MNIAYPLRPFCQKHRVQLLTATVEGINLHDQVVVTNEGPVEYDFLVLGLGSQTNYFGMRDVEERAHGLKSLPAASAIRREIIGSVEAAADAEDANERRRNLTFIVVGAGATGVELVGSIHDFVHHNLLPYYPTLDPSDVRILLIEATDTILPGVDEKVRTLTKKRFQQLGIDLRLRTAVSGVDAGAVTMRGGDRIPANTIIWAAGIKPNPVTAGLPIEKSRDGRVVVDEYLRLNDHPNVFALGDNALATNRGADKPLPPNASVAYQQGATTARNLQRLVLGEPIEPFHYRDLGDLIALGRWHAAAEIGPLKFGGLPAWFVWRGFYLMRLMGMKNRAGVVFDWIATIFSRRYIVDIER
jgi:NADH dehydrogenase